MHKKRQTIQLKQTTAVDHFIAEYLISLQTCGISLFTEKLSKSPKYQIDQFNLFANRLFLAGVSFGQSDDCFNVVFLLQWNLSSLIKAQDREN